MRPLWGPAFEPKRFAYRAMETWYIPPLHE